MGLTDTEREPPKIIDGRVPIRVDPDRDVLDAEDTQIAAGMPDLPEGEFRLDLDDGNATQIHGTGTG